MAKICGMTDCPMYNKPNPMLAPIASGKNPDIMILLDSPDIKDTHRIFTSESAKFLTEKLKAAEIMDGRAISIATAVRCYCDQNDMSESLRTKALKCCKNYFIEHTKKYPPKLIISFGGMALTQATKQKGVKKYQGTFYKNEELNCHVFPLYAPGYILRNQSHEETWNTGFNQIRNFIANGFTDQVEKPKQRILEEVQSIKGLFTKQEALDGIAIDTETQGLDWTHPLFTCVSYSIAPSPDRGYQVFLFEECPEEEKDYSIKWNRKQKSKNVPVLVHVKRSENFEEKLRELRWFLENDQIKKIMHNGNYDCHVFTALFKVAGRLLKWNHDKRAINIKGYNFDTQNAAQLYNENVYQQARLESLQFAFTDITDRYDSEEFKSNFAKDDMLGVPREALTRYACLHKDSLVFMSDGRKLRISEVVNHRINEEVLSYNIKTQKVEAKKVIGWHKNPYKEALWYKIVTNDNPDNKITGPIFTPDHRLLTQNGYKPVEQINVDCDRIITQEPALSSDSISFLLGCLLGDGYFSSRWNSGAGFIFSQNIKRADFVELAKRAFDCKNTTICKGTKETQIQAVVPHNKEFTDLYKNLPLVSLTDKIKLRITDDLIPQLGEIALAVWYFSDGTLVRGVTPRIYQYHMDTEQMEGINRWMASLGLTATQNKVKHPNDRNHFIFWDSNNRDAFFKIVRKYATPDLMYKLPIEHQNKDMYHFNFRSTHFYAAEIKAVVKWDLPVSRGYKTSYCLDVEDNHNFLTSLGFVHNCLDTVTTKAVSVKLKNYLSEHKKLERYMTNMVMPTLETLRIMEQNGAYVDVEALEKATIDINALAEESHIKALDCIPKRIIEAHTKAGLKLTRNNLVKDTLYSPDGFKIEPINFTKSKEPSADQDTLKLLLDSVKSKKAQDFIHHFTNFKKYDKLAGTYLGGFKKARCCDGKIHTKFTTCLPVTGRVSSSKPNVTNIPNKGDAAAVIRRIIAVPPGYKILKADASQAELRWMAHYAQERAMMKIFRDGIIDIHTATAQFVAGYSPEEWNKLDESSQKMLRKQAKCVNFGLIYGMSVPGYVTYAKVVYNLMDMTQEIGQQHSDGFFGKYKDLRPFYEDITKFGQKHGYVESVLGRRRNLPELNSKNKGLYNQAVRQAVNFPIQAASSDTVLLAANEIIKMDLPKNDFKLILFIHDELVAVVREDCDIDKYARILKDNIENPPLKKLFGVELSVPLESEVEFGDNLNDCKKWKFS